jgi:hypothetical protein
LKDEEGIKTMRVLGENMAWLLKKIKGKRQKTKEKRQKANGESES